MSVTITWDFVSAAVPHGPADGSHAQSFKCIVERCRQTGRRAEYGMYVPANRSNRFRTCSPRLCIQRTCIMHLGRGQIDAPEATISSSSFSPASWACARFRSSMSSKQVKPAEKATVIIP